MKEEVSEINKKSLKKHKLTWTKVQEAKTNKGRRGKDLKVFKGQRKGERRRSGLCDVLFNLFPLNLFPFFKLSRPGIEPSTLRLHFSFFSLFFSFLFYKWSELWSGWWSEKKWELTRWWCGKSERNILGMKKELNLREFTLKRLQIC